MATRTDEQILGRFRSATAACARCHAARAASARYCNLCGETETRPLYDARMLQAEVVRLTRRVEELEAAASGVSHA